MKSINEYCKEAHDNAKSKGFYDNDRNVGEMIALMHSELSEALEADRADKCAPVDISGILLLGRNDHFLADYRQLIKGTFEEEMADIVIRVFDMCGWKGIDLEGHIQAKMRYNSMREKMHGKKY